MSTDVTRTRACWPLPLIAGAVSLLLAVTAGPAPAARPAVGDVLLAGAPAAIPGSYVVVLKPHAAAANAVAAKAGELTDLYSGRLGHVYTAALHGFEVSLTERAARRLAAHPAVDYVQQNQRVRLAGDVQADPPSWGLDRIDQPAPALNGAYAYPTTADSARIYVIDTGVRLSHLDFHGRVTSGIDTVDGGAADDCHGHGTHVAGTVGSQTYGVGKLAWLTAVRVLDCTGLGTWAGVIAGVDWVTADHDPGELAVANMSLGGPANPAVDAAVRASIADGVTYVVAAGNNIVDACGISPARVPEAITVGATAPDDARAWFSNYGSCLDVFAPGEGIVSTGHTSDTATAVMDGTSMAAPHVAGAAAITLAANPGYTPQQVRDRIVAAATPDRVLDARPGSPNRLLYVLGLSDAPTILRLSCIGVSLLVPCTVSFAGGVGPYQIRWFYNGAARPDLDNLQRVTVSCPPNAHVVVGVRVIGATGMFDHRSVGWTCRRVSP